METGMEFDELYQKATSPFKFSFVIFVTFVFKQESLP
jgi:hypothetical protein